MVVDGGRGNDSVEGRPRPPKLVMRKLTLDAIMMGCVVPSAEMICV